MSLNRFRPRIESRIALLDTLINQKVKLIPDYPEGYLSAATKNREQYYLVNKKDGTKTYISKSNMELIKTLAQKSYDKSVLNMAKEEQEMVEGVYIVA